MFPHHRHHRLRMRRMGPIGTFVRARLRRRIFAWFLGGLISTALVVAGIMVLVARVQEPEWARSWENSREWVGKQFAREWKDPAARERYAREAATGLDANVDLYDAQGARFFSTGDICRHSVFEAPVRDEQGLTVGGVKICLQRSHAMGWRFFVALGVILGVLWVVSGKVARRLARPLDELAEVVRKIGEGDLKARADLGCYEPDEIGVVADAINDMATRIEKQVEDQRELLATVSHELRTPLARMRVISEIGRDTGATGKTFDDLDREVIEMDSLVGELLASSRLEFGQIAKRELSVRDVASRAVERAGLTPAALAVTGTADTLTADPTLIQRALANLFDNAKKHAQGSDAFEVSVDAERVKFDVLDRGPGVNGNADTLFEKFNKGQDGNGADGLGLGLALVKRIAVAHGGEVWAAPREGGGARFGFSVKRA